MLKNNESVFKRKVNKTAKLMWKNGAIDKASEFVSI